MSLSGKIDEELWFAVQGSYESGNYRAAILDAVIYLSQLIRDKSGLDSDGNVLVGNAFGGPSPIIRVNSFQTESERDEQRGVEQLLRGIYTGIRNPRSHDKSSDSADTAETLIAFMGWLTGLINRSKSPFDTQQIIASVFDKHFAKNEKYADLIVSRIPRRKQLEVLVQVFRRKSEGDIPAIKLFIHAVLKVLPQAEQEQFWFAVSEFLENADTDSDFRSAVQLFATDWGKINDLARMRVEHRLIESIREGEYDKSNGRYVKGALGSWARQVASELTLKDELASALRERLCSNSPLARSYVFHMFFDTYRDLRPTPPPSVVSRLKSLLENEKDLDVFNALKPVTDDVFADPEDNWYKAFKDLVDDLEPELSTDDDIPF